MGDTTKSLRLKLMLDGVASIEAGMKRVTNLIGSVKNAVVPLAGLLGATASVYGVAELIKGGLKFNAVIEQQTIAFKTLLGTMGAAQTRVKELSKFAAQTPFELPEVIAANRLLQTLTGGALATEEGMRLVGDAAAAVGRDFQETAMWTGRLYAGLQSGTPIGEATMRLLEMGLISGETKVKLERLAQSGTSVGHGMEIMRETFKGTSGAMLDQSKTFNGLMSTLKDGFAIMMGESVKPFFDQLKVMLDGMANADWEGIGKKVGAFFGVIIESWRDDKFPEMIALLIESGFELGAMGAKKSFDKLVAFIESDSMGSLMAALFNGVMTFGVDLAKALITILKGPIAFFGAGFDWVYDQTREKFTRFGHFLKEVFAVAINFWAEKFEWMINKSIAAFNDLKKYLGFEVTVGAPVKLGRVSGQSEDVRPAKTIGEAYEDMKNASDGFAKDAIAYLDEHLQAARQVFKVGNFGEDSGALKKLMELMERYIASRKMLGGSVPYGATGVGSAGPVNTAAQLNELLANELKLKNHLVEIEGQLARVETDFTTTKAEKYAERKRLMMDEKATLEKIVATMRERAAIEQTIDPKKALQIEGQVTGYESKIAGVDRTIGGLGPDPSSFKQQFSSVFTELRDEWGTLATQMASTFKNSFNSAISSISNGITGLIMGTMTWGQFLQQIPVQIATQIVGAIVQMGVRWVATQLLMAVMGKSILAASVAASVPFAAAQSAIWAAPATLATIATMGGAAAAAPGLIGIAQGLTLAESLTGFEQGGFTGRGAKDGVAGVVHRGEFVFPQDAVNRIGIDRLNAMAFGNSNIDLGEASSGFSPASAASSNVNVEGHKVINIIVRSEAEIKQAIEKHGPAMAIRVIRENKNEVGIPQ
ncbi:MAG: hypothetical protein JWM68_227 [Verrucomicrobiales bacterium]|nr:hypothetical protein [Verrucomicrobiales bacterium]